MKQHFDIPLHDIKPLMEVPDYSTTFIWIILLLGVLVALLVGYLLVRYFKRARSVNLRKVDYKALKKVDFADAKKAAYEITQRGRRFRDDSDRLREAYENLLLKLEPYKYKREVATIDSETKSYYNIYLGMIDV